MPNKPENTNREYMISIIKSIAGQANILTIPRLFLDLTGDATLALMLAQLIYWSDRAKRPDGFVYKSSLDWQKEVAATDYAVRKFKKLPYVETKVLRANGSPTTHYRVRFDLLIQLISELQPMDKPKLASPQADFNQDNCYPQQIISLSPTDTPVDVDETITEITTKTTTKEINPKGFAQVCAPPETETPPESSSFSEPKLKSGQHKNPNHWPMMQAISKVTGFDLKIRPLAARVGRVAKQLLEADYKPSDVLDFETYWKENDWRWKRERQFPLPTDIQAGIKLSKSSSNYDQIFEEKRAAALKEIEDFEKSWLAQNANRQT